MAPLADEFPRPEAVGGHILSRESHDNRRLLEMYDLISCGLNVACENTDWEPDDFGLAGVLYEVGSTGINFHPVLADLDDHEFQFALAGEGLAIPVSVKLNGNSAFISWPITDKDHKGYEYAVSTRERMAVDNTNGIFYFTGLNIDRPIVVTSLTDTDIPVLNYICGELNVFSKLWRDMTGMVNSRPISDIAKGLRISAGRESLQRL